jgi:N6-adenosine-specific RNA methylase IME4
MTDTIASANEAYGELKANLFIAGFTLERAFRNFLEPLLTGDGWRLCGPGYTDINAFMDSLRLDKFRSIASERKRIAERIKELQPEVSNRQIARTLLGSDTKHRTIDRDLGPNGPPTEKSPNESNGLQTGRGQNGPPPLTGREAAATVARREQSNQPKEHSLSTQPFPQGRYPIILADPPWQYENPPLGGGNRAIENHYPTMTLDQICALPVADLAADDALLYLWATAPKLPECLYVLDAWGFSYRTNIVWMKDRIGMGYHARSQHEHLLIAKRGELPPPPPSDRVSSVVYAPRGPHSEKPVEFYELIERWYPTLPKVELFARAARDGWSAWGNQTGKNKNSASK